MSASSYRPKSKLGGWIEDRLPIFSLIDGVVGTSYATPRNLNYWWNFGSLAGIALVIQIVTGIILAMHYNPSVAGAFDSIQHIDRDVNYGWLLRYMHANGGSMFFIVVYIHLFRGLFYGSYKNPRELLWILGVVIVLLMMATAFMGYVLPWGQMSFWGATVITNLMGALPFVGDAILSLLWGDFAVDNATLNRFFSLHYLLPFVIVGVVIMHIWALHQHGSGNPLGIDAKGPQDKIPFHPFYTAKDIFGMAVFLLVFFYLVFYNPNLLGHPDNYIEANRMVTPAHIVPEWYFLPFYAILRAFTTDIWILTAKLQGVLAMLASILVLFIVPWLDTSKVRSAKFRPIFRQFFYLLVIDCFILGWAGANSPDRVLQDLGPDEEAIAMVVEKELIKQELPESVLTAFAAADSDDLAVLESFASQAGMSAEEFEEVEHNNRNAFQMVHVAQLGTAFYFFFFFPLMPLLGWKEKTKPLPESIANPVVKA